VFQYGELGIVVRPGAKVHAVGGWEEEGGSPRPHAGQERLRAGDLIVSVGSRRLPAGANVGEALVQALRDEATAAAAGGQAGEAAAALAEVKMTVLRPAGAGDEAAGGGSSVFPASPAAAARQAVLQMDALDLLMYDVVVCQNAAVGYRRPADVWEAAAMTGRELTSWMGAVLDCWRQALSAATGSDAAAAAGSSLPSSGGAVSAPPQMVGPLGLVASAAAAVAADRASRAPSCVCDGGSAETAAAAGAQAGGAVDLQLYDDTLRHPHPLLLLGAQLNLQLLPLGISSRRGGGCGAKLQRYPRPRTLGAAGCGGGGRQGSLGQQRSDRLSAALLGSGLLVAGWVAALSLSDLVGLMDRGADRLAAALSPSAATSGGAQSPRTRVALQLSSASASSAAADSEWEQLAAA
ncbi:hypothetical protein TSOC_012136, partial [Tetrabaena socialis]